MRLRFKLHNFFLFFPLGIIGPYFALYLYQMGFTGVQVGLLLGTLPITTIFFQPVWSYLSDVLNTRRLMLVLGCLGAAGFAAGLAFADSFTATFLCGVMLSIMASHLIPVSTAIVLDYLEGEGKTESFGLIRLWGSIGFSVSSLVLGSLFLDQITVFYPWFLAGTYLVLGLLSFLLPEKGKTFVYPDLGRLDILKDEPLLTLFLLSIVFIGATLSISTNYQTLYLQIYDAVPLLVGATVSLQAVLEVPMMMVTPWLLSKFTMTQIILAGAVGLPLRWFLYIFIKDPAWVVPTQLLHGAAIVSFMVVGVSFIDKYVDKKWRATGQGLYNTAIHGVGSSLGLYMAGTVFEWMDITAVWILNTILGVVAVGLLYFSLRKFRAREIKNPGSEV